MTGRPTLSPIQTATAPRRVIWLPWLVVAGVLVSVSWAVRSPREVKTPATIAQADLQPVVNKLDRLLSEEWKSHGITPAGPADELQVLRRLALALMGTIPSLEEIRQFQADCRPDRLARWTDRWLEDRRFADYFAVRLARAYVGADNGQFILFRRDRFTQWLSEKLQSHTSYDEIVREMLASQGLWTGEPAVNFITAAVANDEIDRNKLAARTSRAFLGQRIDCAQCHDHPFDHWKQGDFEGLAAYFAQVQKSIVGIEDKSAGEFKVEDRKSLKERVVAPCVPFDPEWLPAAGTRRERLAAWVTHPDNRRFSRATANRVWALMFGTPFVSPVDGLPDPPARPDVLDLLADDFRTHGCDLRRLVRVIAASRPFVLDSAAPDDDEPVVAKMKEHWAVFPLVRLRPEQVIGAILQTSSVRTIDLNSHLLTRTIRLFRERDFVREYGDLGEDELQERSGTIPQALLRLNGNLIRELSQANPFSAPGRIAAFAPGDEERLNTLFLVCLTRLPTAAEREHFLPQFADRRLNDRGEVVEDLCWSMFNSPEFSWNH